MSGNMWALHPSNNNNKTTSGASDPPPLVSHALLCSEIGNFGGFFLGQFSQVGDFCVSESEKKRNFCFCDFKDFLGSFFEIKIIR